MSEKFDLQEYMTKGEVHSKVDKGIVKYHFEVGADR